MGDAGVVAQRYNLILFGNHQRLELQSWQPETHRTVTAPFPGRRTPGTGVKLRVENMPDGKVRRSRQGVATSDPEPEKWLLEKVDDDGQQAGQSRHLRRCSVRGLSSIT